MWKHVIILKNGDSLTGVIKDKEFSVKTSYATLKFKKNKIVHIHYKNSPQFDSDEMLLKTTDRIRGDISPKKITLKLASSTEVIKIPKEELHTIIFLDL